MRGIPPHHLLHETDEEETQQVIERLSSPPSPWRDWVANMGKGVMPAKAGIQCSILFNLFESWMPASAGMTNYDIVSEGVGGRG